MATISWAAAVSDLFSTALRWTGGVVPGAGDDTVLGVLGGGAYTVTSQNQTVNSLTTAANATLALAANTNFVMTNGTGAGANAGQITVANNDFLYIGGTVNNTSVVAGGGLVLNGTANATEIRLLGATTTFTGAGKVVLGTGGNNYVLGNAGATNTLLNVNNTFSGVGNIGNGSLTLVNQTAGIVNANQTGVLTLQVNGGVTNTGLLEATNTGGLFVLNTTIDNSGNANAGKITATGAGAHVDLQNSYILGGALTSGVGAQIDVVAGQVAYFDGSQPGAPVNITAGTNINVNNNSFLYLYGAINNVGAINLLGTINTTELRLVTPVTTLTGAGQVVLGGGTNYITANGGALNELDNVDNTISGAGNIGAGNMTLVNETAGVINANQTGQLTIQVNGGVTNTGLIEATNTGGLFILNSGIDNTYNAGAGKISAIGAGAHVDLQNSQIYGGTLTTSGAGAVIDVVGGQTSTLDGSYSLAPIKIVAGSTIMVNNNSFLYLKGTINNAGSINLGVDAEPNTTEIRLTGPSVTLTGAGVVNLSNSSNNYITSNDNYSETLNNVDNTIQGSGNIGAGSMTLINGKLGVIKANQAPGIAGSGKPGQLVLQVNGGVINNGLIESAVQVGGPGGENLFVLNTSIDQTGGGKLEALGLTVGATKYGSSISLQNSIIHGGTLISTANNPSKIEIVSGQTASLDGSTKIVTVSAVFNVNNNSTLNLYGAISTKSGSLNLLGAANSTILNIAASSVTLSGTGKVNLSNSGTNVIQSNGGYQTLYNVDNTISGAGNIGNGTQLALVNETSGVVNANQTTALTLQVARSVLNYGLIESNTSVVGAGGLFIVNSVIDNTVANATNVLNTGKITAAGATGHVDLQNSNIYGGTLTSSGTAFIDVVSGQAAGLNGTILNQAVNLAAGTQFTVNNNSTLYLYGAINNAGTITLSGGANATQVLLNSSVVTLTGGGQVLLAGGTNVDRIAENQSNAKLDNVNNTILGAGRLGDGGQMYLTNEAGGTINATLAGGIAINLGGVTTINAGILEATGSNLSVTNSVYNTGSIVANGGAVTIGGNVGGAGTETLSGSSSLEIGSSVGPTAAQTVTFSAGATGVFKIDTAQSFTGTVAGLSTGKTIDLGNLVIGTATLTYAGSMTNGVLTVTDGTIVSTIKLTGHYTQANFHLANDGGGHTNVTYTGTGLAPSPAANSAVNQMVSAMASLGVGSSAASMSSSAAHSAGGVLLALPHAA